MSTSYTEYYNLGKQTDHADKFDMDVITDNADKIDAALHEQAVSISTVTANEAIDRAALVQLVDGGPKNSCKLGFTSKAATSSSPSITNNGSSITINGSRSTSSATILVYDLVDDESLSQDTRYTLPAGKYVCKGTGDTSVRVQVFAHSGTAESLQKLSDVSTDNEFEYTSSLKQDYPYLCFRIWIAGSSTFDNVTIYPMICSKAAWNISQAYQPYRPSYQEMYDMILAL